MDLTSYFSSIDLFRRIWVCLIHCFSSLPRVYRTGKYSPSMLYSLISSGIHIASLGRHILFRWCLVFCNDWFFPRWMCWMQKQAFTSVIVYQCWTWDFYCLRSHNFLFKLTGRTNLIKVTICDLLCFYQPRRSPENQVCLLSGLCFLQP